MFRCDVCGSIGLNPGACGVCGGVVGEISSDSSGPPIVSRQKLRSFWTRTRIVASLLLVLVAVSTVGAGLYLSARPPGPSCSNRAVNYPSCNSCSSQETYISTIDMCTCTNNTVNPPSCNRYCANNAINPPNCDRCPDNQTDVVCSPGVAPADDKAGGTLPILDSNQAIQNLSTGVEFDLADQ
jgi:hypothetical protein